MFFIFLIKSLQKNLLFRPVIVYGLILYLYPLVSNGIFYWNFLFLYPWHPTYSEIDYIKSIEISIYSLLPITALPFILRRQVESLDIKGSLGFFFIIKYTYRFILFVIFGYALLNLDQFFARSYGEQQIFGIITFFDYLLFSIVLAWRGFYPHVRFSKIDILLFSVYVLLKILSGGRMFLVVFGLLLSVDYIRKHGLRLNSYKVLFIGVPSAVLALGSVVVIRERTGNFLSSFYGLSIEYVNASFSSLKIASISDKIGYNWGMLLDPIISLIPSNILSRDYFCYFEFIDKFGGFWEFAPVGGLYLPHQIYLICPSFFWQVFYFSVWTVFLYFADNIIFIRKGIVSGYKYTFYLGSQSLLLIFSVRHFFFVHIKTFFLVLIIVFAYYFILQILIKHILGKDFKTSITIS